ncbi:hypothetical protein CVD28_05520 [Bacillus sp. M6-12]|uniref:TRAP transporter substrate-binding protein DctP n=1 Tax=Bacillus sp. M6-12 TaxID=2054166 RepID=UPI000C761FE7|nr:TRAP transporter substrate-binding protein DctP [Bacillus sp. M6-12]PLS18598.1 hypothetical protein CVD28_05520 [Bacillus sp. M6-12]
MRKFPIITKLSVTALMLTGILAGCGKDTAEPSASGGKTDKGETIEIKAVAAFAVNSVYSTMMPALAESVEKKSDGRLKINFLGGPEVVPPFQLGESVKGGNVDLAFLPSGYYTSVVPEAEVMTYSDYTFDEEKENGAYDYINKIHEEKGNMHLLHSQRNALNYALYTNKAIKKVEDLKGFSLRVAPSHIPFAKAVGADSMTIGLEDVYSALERGMVDGVAFVDVGITDLGWQKQIKQRITPNIYVNDTELIVNNDKWNSLPDHLKDILYEAAEEASEVYTKNVLAYGEKEKKEFETLGIEELNLGDELPKIAEEAGWKHLQEVSGDNAAKLEELFRKK